MAVAENLSSLNPETNVIFSPDQRFVLTGTAGPRAGNVPGKEVDVRGKPGGRVIVMKRENLEIVREMSESPVSRKRAAYEARLAPHKHTLIVSDL